MPRHNSRFRRQDAVLWPFSGFDEYGRPTVGEPVELRVRWESKSETITIPSGAVVGLDALVVLDREVTIHSLMWLSPYTDREPLEHWYGEGSAGDSTGLMEVILYEEVPDIRSRFPYRTAGLNFYKDQLPS